MFCCVLAQHLLDLGEIVRVIQMGTRQQESALDEVDVTVGKTRQRL